MSKPAALAPVQDPPARLAELLAEVRAGRPLPSADHEVLDHYIAIAERCSEGRDWSAVAEAIVSAELVDRGFRFHHMSGDAACRHDELLLGDYCLVCAAELATRMGRSDVDLEFARAAMAAALGDDYQAHLERAVETAVTPGEKRPVLLTADAPGPLDSAAVLGVIEARMRDIVAADPPVVAGPMGAMLEAGGKRLRPQLAFLASTLGTQHDPSRASTLACVIEFIHNATLVHDDLVDDSPLRRGMPATHVSFGAQAAVRVGDYYFGRAAALLASLENADSTRLVVVAVALVCQAQIEEFSSRGMDHLDEARYLKIVEGKTAALFSGACAAGAALSSAGPRVVQAMADYAKNLGIAFQMVDDVLDFSPTSGKTLVQDLRQSVGLPLVYAGEDPAIRQGLANLLLEDDFDAEAAVRLVQESGALERTMARAAEFRDRALQALEAIPDGPARDRFREIAVLAVARTS
ncbi:MAG: octaprenyl-diphosphate synthase [Chloroflexota bacterium]|nr:octaprenyl-diphosphate synthase [Chloroflexota bacterium]